MQTFEYALQLSSGEYTDITEINFNALGDEFSIIFDECNNKTLSDVLKSCTFVNELTIEDAKIGLIKPLEKVLKSPPKGALIKFVHHECTNIKDCPGRSKIKCSTKTIENTIPDCFDYDFESYDNINRVLKEFVGIVISAWRENRYVFIVKKELISTHR